MNQETHYNNFVFDYYPLGIPLIVDGPVEDYVAEKTREGMSGSEILANIFFIYLDEMEKGSPRGEELKSKLSESLKRSGVNCIAITMGNTSKPISEWSNIQPSISWWKHLFDTTGLLTECHSPGEVFEAYDAGKVSALLCLQDGGCIGNDLDKLDELYKEGVRFFQISYNKANSLGHGSTEAKKKGLTDFGRRAVEKMNDLNMIVDVAHSNYQTTMDAIRCSKRPVMVSHSSCESVFMHYRAKSDEELRALAEKGGYFGVLFVPSFISSQAEPSFDVVIDHVRHAVDVMGIDSVGIGSDWGLWSPDVPAVLTDAMLQAAIKNLGLSKNNLIAGTAPGGMKDFSDMFMVTEALLRAGFNKEETKKLIGGNFLDFWRRSLTTRL